MYWVDVRWPGSGTVQTDLASGRGVWPLLKSGDTVTVFVWHGRIMIVWYGETSTVTLDYPAGQAPAVLSLLSMSGGLFPAFILILLADRYRGSKRLLEFLGSWAPGLLGLRQRPAQRRVPPVRRPDRLPADPRGDGMRRRRDALPVVRLATAGSPEERREDPSTSGAAPIVRHDPLREPGRTIEAAPRRDPLRATDRSSSKPRRRCQGPDRASTTGPDRSRPDRSPGHRRCRRWSASKERCRRGRGPPAPPTDR